LKACKHLDEIVPYETEQDLDDILRSFKIEIRIIVEEYKDKKFTGSEFREISNIKLYFNRRNHRFSSSSLRREVYNKEK
jgi:glycerol-3-phosphate cytidylyltransferase